MNNFIIWCAVYILYSFINKQISAQKSKLGGNYIPRAYGQLSESADDITYNSVFFNYGTPGLNTPSNYGILVTLRAGSTNYGYWGLQLFFSASSAILWKRVGNSGSDEWDEWKQIGE